MTPANRAPKFVVLTADGLHCGSYATEQEARNNMLTSDCTIHPIGPALPAKVAAKSLGQVACNAGSKGMYVDWDAAAAAVIAAHEAGRGVAERVVRYALRGPDGKWWSHVKSEYVTDRTQRRLWEDRYEAEKWFEDGDTVVKVTITRRRRVVK